MPKVTTRSLCPEFIVNLKLPIDAFYRESRSGVNIAKRNITTELFGLYNNRKFCYDNKKKINYKSGNDPENNPRSIRLQKK